jgi:intraflagellar transport protein 80
MALAFGHLVVITASQCLSYRIGSWTSPSTMELKAPVGLVKQAQNCFLLVDRNGNLQVRTAKLATPPRRSLRPAATFLRSGTEPHKGYCLCWWCRLAQIYGYDGRSISAPKLSNAMSGTPNPALITLSNDTLVVRDPRLATGLLFWEAWVSPAPDPTGLATRLHAHCARARVGRDEKAMHVFDVQSGKPLGKALSHTVGIVALQMEQSGDGLGAHLALIDKNRYWRPAPVPPNVASGHPLHPYRLGARRDLFLVQPRRSQPRLEKLATMVLDVAWHDSSHMLAALFDGKLVTWFFPRSATHPVVPPSAFPGAWKARQG